MSQGAALPAVAPSGTGTGSRSNRSLRSSHSSHRSLSFHRFRNQLPEGITEPAEASDPDPEPSPSSVPG